MSRRHDAQLRGTVEVLMVCDECGKEEWRKSEPLVDDFCAEYDATLRSSWSFADDGLVCSDACAQKYWNNDDWDEPEF